MHSLLRPLVLTMGTSPRNDRCTLSLGSNWSLGPGRFLREIIVNTSAGRARKCWGLIDHEKRDQNLPQTTAPGALGGGLVVGLRYARLDDRTFPATTMVLPRGQMQNKGSCHKASPAKTTCHIRLHQS